MKRIVLFTIFSFVFGLISFSSASGMEAHQKLCTSLNLIESAIQLEEQAEELDKMFNKKVDEQINNIQEIKRQEKKAQEIDNKPKLIQLQRDMLLAKVAYEDLTKLKQEVNKTRKELLKKASKNRIDARQLLDATRNILYKFK